MIKVPRLKVNRYGVFCVRVYWRDEANWLSSLAEALPRIVVVELGAGTAIPSVRHFSHRISQKYGVRIICTNPRESQVPSARDVGISMGSLETLKAIDMAIPEPHSIGK